MLDLYDPDRAQDPDDGTAGATWGNFLQQLNPPSPRKRLAIGAGIRLLTQTVTSPTLAAQIQALREKISTGQLASMGAARAR